MFTIDDVDALWDHIAYVILYAPDEFPKEDFLREDQQMNLDRSFTMLRQGVEVAYPDASYFLKRAKLNIILDQSLNSYRMGDGDAGSDLLHEFQNNIFKIK